VRYYLAARYQRLEEINQYAKDLRELGHTVDCRWLTGSHQLHPGADKIDQWHGSNPETPMSAQPFAKDDVDDIAKSNALIAFTEAPYSEKGRGGRHVEFGIALASGKEIIIIGPRENVFHCLPTVKQYAKWEDFIFKLKEADHE
jgi:hypothetical protein